MNKHLFKKYGAQNPITSAAKIPIKKTKYTTENKMLLQNSSRRVSLTSECTIESRRISVSTSAIEANESNQEVFQVVCCSHCNIFEKQLQAMGEKIEVLQNVVETQNAAIMDAIAGQKVATEQLVRQEAQNTPVVKYFPICDIPEMRALECKITSANRDIYEAAISSILCNNIKNISMLLKIDVINELNVDGSHGKVGLKSFPNFYGALTGAIAKMPFKGLTPEDTVRSALKFEKAKYFKKAYRQKKKNFEN
ncbi:PREDICTED: uncharacterized protein LOC108381367 isoform X1 [Rhagoletis zephyria]|uniref:uncharacterized protein LOC108381367 isoform X1 n=1 Tax=Rhagoletis zephyria TaxID=28612 RepID=UPI00081187D4|nr:PREDICTED: uncharacterized protein LOC108381367 isoform X1 [Rhagoletis zephyria]